MKLIGFGACMISGYPFSGRGEGFFEVLTKNIASYLAHEKTTINTEIVSLHAFTATRASKYIFAKVIDKKPDLVVLQFGSTDCDSPAIHRKKRKKTTINQLDSGDENSNSEKKRPVLAKSSYMDRTRWIIASILGYFLEPQPLVSEEDYFESIEFMISALNDKNIKCILLSPFPFGIRHSHVRANYYSKKMFQISKKYPYVLFLDCIDFFENCNKAEILLSDGFHLSQFGHKLLGDYIFEESVVSKFINFNS